MRSTANKVEAQQARRILDRLVGYKISPLLWDKVRRGLSAGRVQSVALRIICDREREIEQFVPREYWSLTARLRADEPPAFKAKLIHRDGKKIEPAARDEVEAVLAELGYKPDRAARPRGREQQDAGFQGRGDPGRPRAVQGRQGPGTAEEAEEPGSRPSRPRSCSRTPRASSATPSSRTMRLAQGLYEGREIGDAGTVGLITYMRTDSTRVSDEAIAAVREYIGKTYGKKSLP